MATLPKVLINRAEYQIGGGIALPPRTQALLLDGRFMRLAYRVQQVGKERIVTPRLQPGRANRAKL